MSTAAKTLATEGRRSPGKLIALGAILLLALFIWSNAVFGEEKATAWENTPFESTSTAQATSFGVPRASAPVKRPIASFSEALARIETWEQPLLRSETGVWNAPQTLRTADVGQNQESALDSSQEIENLPEKLLPIDLSLSGTAIFGDSRWALFGAERVQEGGNIGRYVVMAIRPRLVELLDGDQIRVLRMSSPELSARATISTD